MRWRQREAQERFAERRRRENDAPRLLSVVPALESLKLRLEEHRAGGTLAEASHLRPIVVAHAPALFVFTCQDSSCKDGGHDLTSEILLGLKSKKEEFQGEDACRGQVGSAECARVLRYTATATYRA
jgi:hypothetical protein